MKLKKINGNLQKALIEANLVEANDLQEDTFSAIKSGADCVIIAEQGSGKTTTIVLNVIQKLEKSSGESTRALILVEDKEKVVEMKQLFELYGNYTDLRVLGVHEKGNIDFDKNAISEGLDVLIGTPNRVNAMFASAGFNINTIKIFVVDDADRLFSNRMDAVVQRLFSSIEKTQRIFFASRLTDKVEVLADKVMIEPLFFEDDDEDIEDENEELEDEL